MFLNWIDFVDDCLIEKERKIKMVLMKIFHRQEMEVIDRLKEIRERGKASKQIQRMCRGHLGRLALKRKRKESNEMEKERRKLIQQKIDDLMDIVNTKLSNSINNAIRSKLNKLVRVMNKHYKAKEEEKKKEEEKEKMELEAETKRKREEAEKKPQKMHKIKIIVHMDNIINQHLQQILWKSFKKKQKRKKKMKKQS